MPPQPPRPRKPVRAAAAPENRPRLPPNPFVPPQRKKPAACETVGVIRMRQPHGQVGQLGRLPPADRPARAGPSPCRARLCADNPRRSPSRKAISLSQPWPDGARPATRAVALSFQAGGKVGIARGGGQRRQVGLAGRLEAGQRVDINKNRADDLAPIFARGDVALRPAEMRAAPVIKDDRVGVVVGVEVADQFLLGRAAAQIFDGRVDEPDADVLPGARPAKGRELCIAPPCNCICARRNFCNSPCSRCAAPWRG